MSPLIPPCMPPLPGAPDGHSQWWQRAQGNWWSPPHSPSRMIGNRRFLFILPGHSGSSPKPRLSNHMCSVLILETWPMGLGPTATHYCYPHYMVIKWDQRPLFMGNPNKFQRLCLNYVQTHPAFLQVHDEMCNSSSSGRFASMLANASGIYLYCCCCSTTYKDILMHLSEFQLCSVLFTGKSKKPLKSIEDASWGGMVRKENYQSKAMSGDYRSMASFVWRTQDTRNINFHLCLLLNIY